MTNWFTRDCRGGVAITFGLSALGIAMLSGLALDYTIIIKAKSKNQAALDAAVLASVTSAKSPGEAKNLVAKYYGANGGEGRLEDVDYVDDGIGVTISARASYDNPNAFGGILNRPTSLVQVESEGRARAKLTELTITPISAGGSWSKTMTLHKVDEETGVDSVVGYVMYEFGLTSAFDGKLTTDMHGTVSLINTKEAYFQMDIDDDPSRSWYLDNLTVKTMRTNDPETAHHIFVDGRQLTSGVAVNLADIIPCGEEVRIAWEDGGDFAVQDFFFDVSGKCTVTAGSQAYLVR